VSAARVGTSGWSYPSWQPGFYPAGIDRSAFLSFYAERFAAVELNATKYRLPSEAQFRRWADQVPDGFSFAVKAPPGVAGRLDTFQERVRALGSRLGCVRLVVEAPRDDGLVELVLGSSDPMIRWAFDLRHPSWDGIEERLAVAGAVRVGDEGGAAGWAYLRFRELAYAVAELDGIATRLRDLTGRGIETFAFFRHGDEPDAARYASDVRARASG
jgi:uncharacterized protein YecE (DUF72 family)